MATMISLCRLVMVCAALVLGACATRGGLNEVRQSLSWDGDLITWTVENPTAHSIIIDDYTETDMGVPVGVWIRVTEATGERLAYSNDNDGWHSPWIMWSSAWTRQPLELAPSARLRHTFTATDLAVGIRVTWPIASARCRYQLRVAVSDPDLRVRTVQVSDWRDIECAALQIPYCPLERGVGGNLFQNCSGGLLPQALRAETPEQ